MKPAKIIVLFLLLFTIGGCANYEITRSGELSIQVPKDSIILIEEPLDGTYNGKRSEGSGRKAALVLHRGFARYFDNVRIDDYHDASAKLANYRIRTDLIHWEDRATEWSGKPDRITVKMELIDLQKMRTTDVITVEAKSTWFTLGGDHPEHLLNKPSKEWAKELLGK